jgi:mono/diheme cytochrome c family protein
MLNMRFHSPCQSRCVVFVCLLLTLLLAAACRDSGSVVSDEGQKPLATNAANNAQPAEPAATAPAPPPATPGDPGSAPPVPASGERRSPSISNVPLLSNPNVLPMPKPTPTAKPQPTPVVVKVDGKIVQQWPAPPEAAKLENPFKGNADAVRLGREYFMQRCEACHGKEGKGNGWMAGGLKKPPTNLASVMVQANTDGELYWKITNGRSPMPANRVRFEDDQRWQIVTFLRTLK